MGCVRESQPPETEDGWARNPTAVPLNLDTPEAVTGIRPLYDLEGPARRLACEAVWRVDGREVRHVYPLRTGTDQTANLWLGTGVEVVCILFHEPVSVKIKAVVGFAPQ